MNKEIENIVLELDRISDLVSRYYEVDEALNSISGKQKLELNDIDRQNYPSSPNPLPVFDTLQYEVKPFYSDYVPSVKRNTILLSISAAALILSLTIPLLFPLCLFGFFGSIIFGFLFYKSYKPFAEEKKQHDEQVQKRQQFEEIIRSSHSHDIIQFQAEMNDFFTKYSLYLHLSLECINKFKEEKNRLTEEQDDIAEELNKVTLLSAEHLHLASRMSALFKNGRADTLKEALNMAIADARYEDANRY